MLLCKGLHLEICKNLCLGPSCTPTLLPWLNRHQQAQLIPRCTCAPMAHPLFRLSATS
jgi:hypothetical protein